MVAIVIASLSWLVVIWQLVRRHNAQLEQSSVDPEVAAERVIASSVDPTVALLVTALVPFGAFWVLWKMRRGQGILIGLGVWLGITLLSTAAASGFARLLH